MSTETFEFQAEINQLLSLIINTFYSNKDIFLRELISNSSDAIDKARYNIISNGENSKLRDFKINISANLEEKIISIEDNGIGMTKDDMVKCLGTIANSGTKSFMESLTNNTGTGDMSMIGQFGVGFYSAYLVADTVKVYSKHDDSEHVYCWESKAGGSFTITEIPNYELDNGTKLVLYMKEDCLNYLEEQTITDIIKTHSQYITYPINLWTTRTESKEVPIEEEIAVKDVTGDEDNKDEEGKVEDEEGKVEDEEGKVEDVTGEEEDSKPKTKTVTEEIQEWKKINTQKPIWTHKPEDVSHEEYAAFYKSITNDWDEHQMVKHFSVEGQIEFKSVLFVPKRAPFDLFKTNNKRNNIKLYVKRVFIMDKCEDLIPDWLSFVSGIVDSEDLPLNVSREILQQNKITKVINKNIVKKCIEMFTDMANDEDKSKYKTFYENYHQSIKLGIHEDSNNRDKLVKLLRFQTLNHTESISLEDYVKNMKDEQKEIYYITGESRKSVENSPFVNGIKKMGYDVLFLIDAIDEYMTQQVKEFQEMKLVNISKENTLFQEQDEELKKDYEEHLCKKIKEVLSNEIEKVIVSTRLSDDPSCLVSSEYGWSANMERIMKAQTLQNNSQMYMMGNKKTMEINPNHNIINKLQDAIKNSNLNDTFVTNSIHLLYDTALLASGYVHDDPSKFTKRIYNMLSVGIGTDVDIDDTVEEVIQKSDVISEEIQVTEEVVDMEQID
jgi:molecular chaperone HtpG